MSTTQVRARVDHEMEQVACQVLADIGLTVGDAIRMLICRIATDRAMPLSLVVPNAETRAAMIRASEMTHARFTNLKDMIDDIERENAQEDTLGAHKANAENVRP